MSNAKEKTEFMKEGKGFDMEMVTRNVDFLKTRLGSTSFKGCTL